MKINSDKSSWISKMSEKNLQKEVEALNKTPEDADVMEEILQQLGGLGTYQRLLFLMMLPIGFIFAYTYGSQMFVTATPQQHWCLVPELIHLDTELRRNLSIPGASDGTGFDRCGMYDANWTQVLASLTPPDPNTTVVPCRNGWEFKYDDIPYSTVVSERGWVCDKASLGPFAQMIFFLGSFVGCAIFGWMGDKYGRVPALIGANLVGFVGGVLSVFTVSFWDFAACRFLVGMANDCCFVMMYILVLEYVDSRYRSWIGNLSLALYVGVGGMTLPGLAYWLRDWRTLLLVTSTPMLLVLTAPWLVPESASWLISMGKTKRAVRILNKFERINNRKISEDLMTKFISSGHKSSTDESMLALIKNAPLRNSFIVLMLTTMASSIMIDAIIRLSESIGTNFFVTFTLSCMAEIPALTLVALILDKVGRRFLAALTISMAGVLSLVCASVPQGIPQLVLALMVRFSINMCVGVQFQLGAEMLPTGLRATGTSLIHIMLCVATAISPFVVYSGRIWSALPLVILAVLGLISGGASLLLPETKGLAMPQTIADAEQLIRENSLCGKPEKEYTSEEMVLDKKI